MPGHRKKDGDSKVRGAIPALLIGLGRIGWKLEQDPLRYHPCTHAGTLKSLNARYGGKAFSLIGACDLREERREEFRKWWGDPLEHLEEDAARLIRTTRPELVIVASSLESHEEIVRMALTSGVKHLVLEKPVTSDSRQARRMLAEAERRGARIWVNFERRYHPAYRKVLAYVREQKLGGLKSVRGQVLTGSGFDSNTSTGPLLHDAVHWIDLLLWFAGPPSGVRSRVIRNNTSTEETAFVRFDYPDFSAQLESGGNRRYFEFRMQLDFEKGRIETGNDGHRLWISSPSRRYRHFLELREKPFPFTWKNPWEGLYEEVRREIRKPGGEEPTTSLRESVKGLELIDLCYKKVEFVSEP